MPRIDWTKVDAASGALDGEDLATEALACLGSRMCLNGLPVPQPTAGAVVLLAAIDSPLMVRDAVISPRDVHIAMTILHGGEAAVSMAASLVLTGDGGEIEINAMADIVAQSGIDPDLISVYIRQQIANSCAGFEMVPGGGEEDVGAKPFAFDAEWLAFYVSRLCPATCMDANRVTWELPLVFGGFLLSQLAKAAGVKDVGRKSNDAAALAEIKRQMEGDADGRE